jgi:hypothetical protein
VCSRVACGGSLGRFERRDFKEHDFIAAERGDKTVAPQPRQMRHAARTRTQEPIQAQRLAAPTQNIYVLRGTCVLISTELILKQGHEPFRERNGVELAHPGEQMGDWTPRPNPVETSLGVVIGDIPR